KTGPCVAADLPAAGQEAGRCRAGRTPGRHPQPRPPGTAAGCGPGRRRRNHAGPPGQPGDGSLRGQGVGRCVGPAVLPGIAGAGLHPRGAGARHAGLPGAGTAPVHRRRQRAQRQGLLRGEAGEIRSQDRPAAHRPGL
ncbi:MAG: Transcriptional regulator, AsnC family, partial [uncultured Ramlibacter sp.]